MSLWVRLCSVSEAPKPGEVTEIVVNGLEVCLANVDGELRALNNICPHRGGPLGQGWLEGTAVVCPWHSWAFDTRSGRALPPDCGKVDVISLRVDGDDVLIEVS
ncbi:MAG TPA: Rieske (2Fe-2S) protein [Bryocella sp.]|nr:Rieske (2Fe-2S) protein [Bryocella sp.]